MLKLKSNTDVLIEETAKRAAKEAARIALEESNSGTSRISQIIKDANKGKSSHQGDDADRIEKAIETYKAEKEQLEKIKAEKEKELEEIKAKNIKIEELKKNERLELEKSKEKVEKDLEESEIFCPTCSNQKHEHKLKKTENGKMKCTGKDCNSEFALIPTTNINYQCTECGLPHSRPKHKEDENAATCPLCGNNQFIKSRTNYDKIREKVEKKQQKKPGLFGRF